MRGKDEKYSSKNKKENRISDFRLLTTKKEKPRFFLLCQQFLAYPFNFAHQQNVGKCAK
jgi:hypothetical protein